MILSRGTDYAIRAMLDLAGQPEEQRSVTEQIAVRQEIPAAFLSKVVAQLTQAGLLRTYRGAAGGVHLARSAEEISLREIVEAIQGPIVLNLCTGPFDGCRRADTCSVKGVFEEAQGGLNGILERASLANLVSESVALRAGESVDTEA